MKLIYKYLVCSCIVLIGTSCNFLDVVPDNVATEKHAFADRYTVEKYLASCYWRIPKTVNWNENPGIHGALEMIFNTEYSGSVGMRMGLGLDNPTSALMNYWASSYSLYAGIRDCNTFMAGIGGVRDLDEYEKKRMIAEIKMIKAYFHFYLLSYYGPICPLRESLPVNESTRGVRVYREKIDDCFQYVIDLMDEVIESEALPLIFTNPTTELGRFTQPAAYLLKAKILLYWASPLFNGNTDYNSFLDHKREPFFNQVYDASRWTAAAEACKKAIDICESAGVRLYQPSDYVPVKKMSDQTHLVQTLRGVITDRWNVELIWSNTSYPADNSLQRECLTYFESALSLHAYQKMSVPLSTVEWFYSKNGIPIEEDITYDYENRFNLRIGDEEHRYYIQKGEQTAVLNFDREPRFYSTLGFDRGKWYGNSYKNVPDDDAEALYPKNRFGEFSSAGDPGQYNATGYWPKKLVSINTSYRDANSITWESYPFPDMRFADLLLMCAEALNESKDVPDAEVYRYIDMVRERAGLEGVLLSWQKYSNHPEKPTTKAGMREIIQRERKIELACESSYYWDSRRWKTAQAEQNRLIQGWNINASDAENYYMVTPVYIQSFSYKNYFAPLPESDIVKNPQLVQNPGW
ncbi:RagB/SusD family nutrient uptake outer membrane protein [Proteiniphilum sp.]|uniref:RagB/SusD family nutrient uptake outer membrane protein n=1 Tax=Proteiniphilum sp. TaxID=1926877 RepID=UPI002B20C024|nr:RagB/SusD family nutrient uptake outer membrane protein [Proteiniphilum sp.]MEA4917687.1 RagB/SusD family nutrient uptake outer membrane protein [Proteiniphilum sp.]